MYYGHYGQQRTHQSNGTQLYWFDHVPYPYIGHHKGDLIGKEAVATGKTIQELVLEKKLLSKEELDRILSIENLMHPEYKSQLHK